MKKRHHVIPRFYLERFVDPRNPSHLWVYDKRGNHVKAQTPVDSSVRSYFYSLRGVPELDPDAIEDLLGRAETTAAPVIKEMLSGRFPDLQGRADFAMFAAFLYTRTHAFRTNVSRVAHKVLNEEKNKTADDPKGFRQMVANYERDTGNKLDFDLDKLRQSVRSSEVSVTAEFCLKFMLMTALKLWSILNDMNWMLAKSSEEFRFVTCDNPLALNYPSGIEIDQSRPGFLSAGAVITLPLSREIALVARETRGKEECRELIKNDVKQVNRWTIANADRFVYAPTKSSGIRRLVERFQHNSGTWEIEFGRSGALRS